MASRFTMRLVVGFLAAGVAGCSVPGVRPLVPTVTRGVKERPPADPALHRASQDTIPEAMPLPKSAASPPESPIDPAGPGFAGPQPVDVFIRRALEANPTVRAARYNVLAVKHRIPQVTALDDPILSNSIFPIPSVAPQYSLMGYMPYGALLAQQFPWCGTLRIRGEAAERDVSIALYELAAAQLDVVAAVKRVYYDLHFNERALALLEENRKLAEDFLKVARERYSLATASQVDVLRAEVTLTDIDREMETTRQAAGETRADLARLLHVDPETPMETLPALAIGEIPQEIGRLVQLAAFSRPDLQGRLAAIERDEKAIELARKRYYPNVTVGVIYQDMEKTNAMTPQTAGGMPNVGLFVGLNLPVYHKKLAAGVCEAQARAAADGQLYVAERDQVHRDIKDALIQARAQQNVLSLLRRSNLPNARRILELTASDYRSGIAGVDYLSIIGAWRELLQVELQIAQVEAELGKALATLERAVGVELNENPPAQAVADPPSAGHDQGPVAPSPRGSLP
jgi:outer membrane protein TolC